MDLAFGRNIREHFYSIGRLAGLEAARSTHAAALDRAIVLTSQTRLMREGHSLGHLLGVEIDPDSHEIVAVVGRHHWWAPKLHLKAETLDFSVPGEIRVH